jgi:hypothetical protein
MPVVNTIKDALKGFLDQKAIIIRTHGCDTTVYTDNDHNMTNAILLIFDNVQHFHKQRDLCIGRDNSMIIGITVTYIELQIQAAPCDIADKRRRITQNKRKDMTVDQILDLIDQLHLKTIGILQWLEALTKNIPSTKLKSTSASKLVLQSYRFLYKNRRSIHWPQAVRVKLILET